MRGSEVNARLGGVPKGKPLIDVTRAAVFPNCHHLCIVLQLPPKGAPIANNRLYRVAVIGRGFHGLLTSPTTHIPGLVSIVDIAPTALGGHPADHARLDALGELARPAVRVSATPSARTTGSSSRPSSSSRESMLALGLLGLRAAVTAVPAALLVNLALGMGQISNEVLLCAAVSAGTVLLALGLARLCRSESALLALYGGVVALYAVVMVTRPEWQAVNPFGPDAELAVLGDREPGRDAAARSAACRCVPRASPLRDRRLRRSSASSVSS